MKQSKPKTYSVVASEEVGVKEKLITDKWWFNGIKRFFTVKVLPSSKK